MQFPRLFSLLFIISGWSLVSLPAHAGLRQDGNLYGAAEVCALATGGLRFSNSPIFQNARTTARRSRQNCSEVQQTMRQSASSQGGLSNGDGNLYGAAESCGISTNGLSYSNSPDFQNARQRARQSRQNCGEVQRTISQIAYNNSSGYIGDNGDTAGNLFGAAENCGIPTNGLAYNNDSIFQAARQRARQSSQNCGEVQQSVNQMSYNGAYRRRPIN